MMDKYMKIYKTQMSRMLLSEKADKAIQNDLKKAADNKRICENEEKKSFHPRCIRK